MSANPLPKLNDSPVTSLTPLDYARYMAKRLGETFVKLDAEGIIEGWARKNPGEFLKLCGKMLPSFQEVRVTGNENQIQPVVIIDNTTQDNRRQILIQPNNNPTLLPTQPVITEVPEDNHNIIPIKTISRQSRQGKTNILSRERLEKAILKKYNVEVNTEVIDAEYEIPEGIDG